MTSPEKESFHDAAPLHARSFSQGELSFMKTLLRLAKPCPNKFVGSYELQGFGETEKEAKDDLDSQKAALLKRMKEDSDFSCEDMTCSGGKRCKFQHAYEKPKCEVFHPELVTEEDSITVKAQIRCTQKLWGGCFCVKGS